MPYLISPLEGVGAIEFGMQASSVRMLIGKDYTSFKRNVTDEFPCDYYKDKGLFIYYKSPGVVEAIELTHPASPELDCSPLLSMTFKDLKKLLKKYDNNLETDGCSSISHALGIGAYAPKAIEEESCEIESIIVFEKGYYD
ncbi:hypothetical protein ACUN9Y_19635 [Halomonas sp. V046]|uniref:hypothetical protein n=1 Tax=Halomonas sp. V046 TaxID=3459611 RepID=UPI004043B77E